MTISQSTTSAQANGVRSGGIRLEGLHKSYGAVHAVRGVDLDIAAGETVALLGPNGAGKSTTIDMLLGLSRPDAGAVSIFGMTPDQAIAEGAIGAMLQTGGIVQGLTVRELLVMMAALYPNPLPVEQVLRSCGIEDLATRRTQSLSGGQTQRVRAAMALVSDPDLLVLDEPTVAMDVEARHAFWSAMRAFAATGRTVVFATHYLEEADSYADRIVLMSAGEIVADGPANEIKATVGRRTIRATLPDVSFEELGRLPGVESVDRRGAAVLLDCSDSDTAIRALLTVYADAREIEITSAGLEAAFLSLTGNTAQNGEK